MTNSRYQIGETLVETYEIREVRFGGMGEVYICFDSANQKYYAFKTFQDKYLISQVARNQFIEEASVWVKLGYHPNIVDAITIYRIDGKPYIQLECVLNEESEVESLAIKLKQSQIDLNSAFSYALQICLGMHFVQVKQPSLVHRDLRPANILISAGGNLKITDFGLAMFPQAVLPAGLKFLGDPQYMSPEQQSGKTIDYRSDIYSFGCILLELFTCQKNYTLNQMLKKNRALWVDVPAEIKELIEKCLADDPSLRPLNFFEIAEGIKRACDSFSVTLSEEVQKSYNDLPRLGEFEVIFFDRDHPWLEMAHSLSELGEYQEALGYINQWLKENVGLEEMVKPENVERDRARFQAEMDQFGPEEPEDENFVATIPRNIPGQRRRLSQIYVEKGIAHANLSQFAEAEAAYLKSIDLDETNANSWYNLGEFLFNKKKDSTNAILAYQKALAIDPNDDWAWNSLGFVLGVDGQNEKAMDCYDRAIQINPKMTIALGNKGVALLENGQIDEAKACFETIQRINPGDAPSRYYLGIIAVENGNPEGIEHLNRASKLAPEDPNIQAALHVIMDRGRKGDQQWQKNTWLQNLKSAFTNIFKKKK